MTDSNFKKRHDFNNEKKNEKKVNLAILKAVHRIQQLTPEVRITFFGRKFVKFRINKTGNSLSLH